MLSLTLLELYLNKTMIRLLGFFRHFDRLKMMLCLQTAFDRCLVWHELCPYPVMPQRSWPVQLWCNAPPVTARRAHAEVSCIGSMLCCSGRRPGTIYLLAPHEQECRIRSCQACSFHIGHTPQQLHAARLVLS